MVFRVLFAFCALGLLLGGVAPVRAADLPQATSQYLEDLKLDPHVLDGIDDELKVPQAWIDGARKEGKLIVSADWSSEEFPVLVKPFTERYPFIEPENSYASYGNRAIAVLLAYRQHRVLADVINGFGGATPQYEEAGALENIADLPNMANVASDQMRDPKGFWVGHQVTYWCMPYNTNLVKPSDLPKTWDDLLTDKALANGALGINQRPQLWLVQLWAAKGDAWGRNFVDKLFDVVKPQLRGEDVNAMVGLVELGELHASLPGAQYRAKIEADKGAPVSFHCPEPVTASIDELGILHGSPDPFAAKLFVNWVLSREGQIAQVEAVHTVPVHKKLQDARFIPYANTIIGKPTVTRTPDAIAQYGKAMFDAWNAHWGTGK